MRFSVSLFGLSDNAKLNHVKNMLLTFIKTCDMTICEEQQEQTRAVKKNIQET